MTTIIFEMSYFCSMKNNLSGLLKHLKNYKWQTYGALISSILATLFSVFSFLFLAPIMQELFKPGFEIGKKIDFSYKPELFIQYLNYQAKYFISETLGITNELKAKQYILILICIFLSLLYLFKNFFSYMAQYLITPVRSGVIKDLRKSIYQKILTSDISFFSNERKGDIVSRATTDVVEVENSILKVIEAYVKEPITIILSFGLLLAISWELTLFVMVLFAFIGLVVGRIGKVLKKQSKEAQTKLGNVTSILDETIFGLRIVKAFTAEKYLQKRMSVEDESYRDIIIKANRRKDLSSPLTEFLGITVVCILIWFGGNMVFENKIQPEFFFVFIGLFYNIIAPAKSFSKAFYNIRLGRGALERIEEFLNAPVQIKDTDNAVNKLSIENNITYNNVSFTYTGDYKVLDNFSLDVKKGQTVALVGSSGAGKSTIADLLPRFYDVSSGNIMIDGIDIRNIKIKDLRSLISIVSQDAILFNDTIYNNIVFGLDNVTPEQVEAAAKKANAHEFIIDAEKGYQTNIGDRGAKLSGGQRQRITIARALLRDPKILILDEATSALDSESEKQVQNALLELMKNRTSIVIAHRLSTIQHADVIVVLERGKIIEKGNHDSLLAKNGSYHKLVKLQSM